MSKCRLMVITDTYVGLPGGSERHLLNFLSNLSDNFEAKVIQLNPDGNPYFKDKKFLKDNVELLSYPLKNIKSIKAGLCLSWLYMNVLKFKPDVVVSYHEKADLLNVAIGYLPFANHKSISSKRDMGLNLDGRIGSLMKRFNSRFNAITAPSNSIVELIETKFNAEKEKLHVIENGLRLSDYGQNNSERSEVRNKLGLPLDKTIIISIGWLRPGKGHQFLIDAISRLNNKQDFYFALLGNGPDQERLEKIAKELGVIDQILFAGMQDNVSEWLSVSDIAVSASLSEGLSNALVEAAASELPIVATNVGGNPEVVEDGFNGYLVESQSSEELRMALSKLTEDSSKMASMGVNSRVKAEKDFSIEKMVSSLENLYLHIKGVSND